MPLIPAPPPGYPQGAPLPYTGKPPYMVGVPLAGTMGPGWDTLPLAGTLGWGTMGPGCGTLPVITWHSYLFS